MLELNKIYNEDFKKTVERLPNESIDLIMTDIPFNISQKNNFKTMKDRKGRTGIDFGEWDGGFDEDSLKLLIPKIKKGGSFFTFHSFEQYHIITDVMSELIPKDRLIWQKTNPMPRNRDRRWISNIEMASWYVKKGERWTFNRQNEKYESSVLLYPSESGGGFKRYHTTQKNLKMIEYLIKIHSNEGDVVYDPFLGGGTTAIASINTNRVWIGSELHKNQFEIARERIEMHKEIK